MTLEVVILSAGDATRMPDAPYGCKSLIELGGQTVLDWQIGALPEPAHVTLVTRSRVSELFDENIDVISHDVADGAVRALQRVPIDGPVLVVFADTIFESIPEERDESWIGVAVARGGRVWEFAGADGHVQRRHVPTQRHLAVHCGVYYFHDPERLAAAMTLPRWDWMVNRYTFQRDEMIEGWFDVGDEEALERAEAWIAGEE